MPSLVSQRAFSAFYKRTHLTVFRYIYGLHGGPRQFVEDLTTETYLKAWDARHTFSGSNEDALRWVMVIAWRTTVDSNRREKRYPPPLPLEEFEFTTDLLSPEGAALQHEALERLWTLLHDLPDDRRQMLILRYTLGWPVERIAAHLGQKPNTISVTIKRTLTQLRRLWHLVGEAHD